MARSLRIQYPGGFYHVMARGNRRERIFLDDDDRHFFLKTLSETCAMTGWRVHAWVLLSNHYHLVIETPEPNLVAGMQWLQNTYTRRFNVRHRNWGRIFGDRYKSVVVEGAGYYYETLLDYVHLNPVRAGLIDPREGKKNQSVLEYPWSSVAGGHALPPNQRPAWLATAEVLKAFDCADSAAGRRKWVKHLDDRAKSEDSKNCGVPERDPTNDGRRSHLRDGWYWGSQAFAEKMRNATKESLQKVKVRKTKIDRERRTHGEPEAQRLVKEGLAAAGLTEAELKTLPGSELRKVAIAKVVWEQTTVGLPWIAARLHMRSRMNASQQIRRHRLDPPNLPKALRRWVNQSTVSP